MSTGNERRPGGESEAPNKENYLPEAYTRCVHCGHPLTAEVSVRRGFGPHCWTRITTAQRHERHEAVHGRLWGLLRRLPSLDVRELSIAAAALDDAVDALDGLGVAL